VILSEFLRIVRVLKEICKFLRILGTFWGLIGDFEEFVKVIYARL
jgi:hypothetical protein